MLETCMKENEGIAKPSDEEISFHLRQIVNDLEGSMEDSVFVKTHISHLLEIAERNNWQIASYYLSMAQESFSD